MKRVLIITGIIVFILIIALPGCAAPATTPGQSSTPAATKAQPIVIKGVAFLPPNRETVIGLSMLAQKVNAKANGQVRIDVLGGPEVIGMFDQPAAVKDGSVDLVLTPTAFYGNMVPEGLVLPLSDYLPWEERQNGAYDWLLKLHQEKMGVYYLGRTQTNFSFKTWTKKTVQTPKDLAGQKIGITPLFGPFTAALGSAGVIVEEPDIYTAMERGVIDGYMLPVSAVVELGLIPVTKFGVDHPFFAPSNLVHIMNLNTWKKLPKNMQDLINQESANLEHDLWDFYGKYMGDAQKKATDGGIKMVTFSAQDAKAYSDLANSSYWDDAKGKMSADSFAQAKKLFTKSGK